MHQPRKILVLKFSSIGDIVQSTSPLLTLNHYFPDARIDFMTLEEFAPLTQKHPAINTILAFEKSAGYKHLRKTGKTLKQNGYDLIVDLHDSLRSKIIRNGMRPVKSLVLKKPRWKRFVLFQFHRNQFDSTFSQRGLLHQPFAEFLDKDYEYPATCLSVSDAEKKQAQKLLELCGVKNEFVLIIPGAAWKGKIWSVSNYERLFRMITEKWKVNIVMLGSSKDRICTLLKEKCPQIIDLHGKTDLRESLAIISHALLVFGSDTGLVHAAEALGVRAVMILGPTSRETGAGNFLSGSVSIENEQLWCRPCSQSGKRPCYREERLCLTSIKPAAVFTTMNNMVDK